MIFGIGEGRAIEELLRLTAVGGGKDLLVGALPPPVIESLVASRLIKQRRSELLQILEKLALVWRDGTSHYVVAASASVTLPPSPQV